MAMTNLEDYERAEGDRRERDRATGLRSLLGTGVCQMCGAPGGTGGVVAWYDEAGERHEELCPYCHVSR